MPPQDGCDLPELSNYQVNSEFQLGSGARKLCVQPRRPNIHNFNRRPGGADLVEVSPRSDSTFTSGKKPGDDGDYLFEAFSDSLCGAFF